MQGGGVLSIREVNAQQIELFEWLFGNVIEHCPEAARAVALKRPYSTVKDLRKAFCDYLDGLDANGETNLKFHDLLLTILFLNFALEKMSGAAKLQYITTT